MLIFWAQKTNKQKNKNKKTTKKQTNKQKKNNNNITTHFFSRKCFCNKLVNQFIVCMWTAWRARLKTKTNKKKKPLKMFTFFYKTELLRFSDYIFWKSYKASSWDQSMHLFGRLTIRRYHTEQVQSMLQPEISTQLAHFRCECKVLKFQ